MDESRPFPQTQTINCVFFATCIFTCSSNFVLIIIALENRNRNLRNVLLRKLERCQQAWPTVKQGQASVKVEMKIDFNDILEKRKEVLDNKKTELDKLQGKLSLSNPVEFSISDIEIPSPRKRGEKVGIKALNNLENIKSAVVYIYEMVDPNIKSELLNSIGKFRSIDNKDENDQRRSTAKIPTDAIKNTSNVLYVGSVEKNIHSRTRQHLGFGHADTFALQLKHWAKSEWKFKFYYIEITNKQILTDIEAQISKELDPLLGKREK